MKYYYPPPAPLPMIISDGPLTETEPLEIWHQTNLKVMQLLPNVDKNFSLPWNFCVWFNATFMIVILF